MAGHRAKQQEGTTVESVDQTTRLKYKGRKSNSFHYDNFAIPYIMLIPRSGQIYITKRRSRKK